MSTTKKIALPHGFFFIDSANTLQMEFLQALIKEKETIEILVNWPRLPFLSIKDNIFLGKPAKKLPDYLADCQLTEEIFDQSATDLTALEEIKLQFLTALLLQKKIVILNESFQHLTVFEIQQILPLCRMLAQQYSLTIYLVSEDKKFADVYFVSLAETEDLKKAYYFKD